MGVELPGWAASTNSSTYLWRRCCGGPKVWGEALCDLSVVPALSSKVRSAIQMVAVVFTILLVRRQGWQGLISFSKRAFPLFAQFGPWQGMSL